MMVTRKCKICGKSYQVCPTCETVKSFMPWRTLVCSLEEYQVFSILSDYLCNKDAVTAAKSLDGLKLSKKTIKGYMPDIQKEIAGVYAAAKQTEESE